MSSFLLPAFLAMYSVHWFRSRAISSPWAKVLGGVALLTFIAGLIGLLPAQVKWKGVIPSEGLLGRIVADFLIHYLNVVGAYLVCLAVIAVGLYLSTAFSFGAMRIWSQTRFGFVYASLDRFADWRIERARKKAAKELEKKRAAASVSRWSRRNWCRSVLPRLPRTCLTRRPSRKLRCRRRLRRRRLLRPRMAAAASTAPSIPM